MKNEYQHHSATRYQFQIFYNSENYFTMEKLQWFEKFRRYKRKKKSENEKSKIRRNRWAFKVHDISIKLKWSQVIEVIWCCSSIYSWFMFIYLSLEKISVLCLCSYVCVCVYMYICEYRCEQSPFLFYVSYNLCK